MTLLRPMELPDWKDWLARRQWTVYEAVLLTFEVNPHLVAVGLAKHLSRSAFARGDRPLDKDSLFHFLDASGIGGELERAAARAMAAAISGELKTVASVGSNILIEPQQWISWMQTRGYSLPYAMLRAVGTDWKPEISAARVKGMQKLIVAMAKEKYGWDPTKQSRSLATGQGPNSIFQSIVRVYGDQAITDDTIREILATAWSETHDP